MINRVFLFIGILVTGVLMQQGYMSAYAQETPSYFQSIDKTIDNCPVTHLFADKMYVPVTIKLFHDKTPTFSVVPRSITNSTNSLVQLDGNDPNAFLVTTNSTDQFDYHAIGSYTDGLEHTIFAEYWSQNKLQERDQFMTEKGFFCHHFFLDTSVAPPLPDYNKMIQDAQAGAFQGLIASVLEDHGSLENLVIVMISSVGVNMFVLFIFLIFNSRSGSTTKKISDKVKKAIEKLQENIGAVNMMSNHLVLSEKQIIEKDKKRDERLNNAITTFGTYARNWQDQFVIAFRSMMLETNMIKQDRLADFEKLVKSEPLRFPDIRPVEEPVIDVTEIEKEIPKEELVGIVETEKKPTLKERILHRVTKKKEIKIMSIEEWQQFFLSKNLNKQQILKLYQNLEPYVQKNYMRDIGSLNKLNALYAIYQELDK